MNLGRPPTKPPTIADNLMAEETVREFKELATVDCKCLDAGTRKVMLFLINERLKTLRTFPRGLMDDLQYDLLDLKQRLLDCKMKRKKPPEGNP